MSLWERMSKIRKWAKKIKFIYEPYKNIKISLISNRKNKYLKKNGMQIVLEVSRILENTSAIFFVDCGTLLGIVRSGNLIDGDLDIDFGIFINKNFTWNNLEKVLTKSGFILDHQYKFKDEITEQRYRKNNVCIDFFNHFNDETNSYHYSYYNKEHYVYENSGQMHVFLLKTVKITGHRKKTVVGGNVYIPIEAKLYLSAVYGDTWYIPNPDWENDLPSSWIELGDSELAVAERIHET